MVVAALYARGIRPHRILEPTCGSGAFLVAAAAQFPDAEIVGIEYQEDRYGAQLVALVDALPRLAVRYADAYTVNFGALPWRNDGPLLIAGNPPWVTAAALGRAGAGALQPPRSNPKGLRGLAARTGAANFDVAEFLILKMMRELRGRPLHLALLVKESVARNVLAAAARLDLGIAAAEIVRIDARAWFGVAVDACCLILSTGVSATAAPIAIRATFSGEPIGWFDPFERTAAANGAIVWRQGIKHDAADVFELQRRDGAWWNGYGDRVDIETSHVYPFLKARALHRGESDGAMALVVPQTRLGAATDVLADEAPRVLRYLRAHRARLAARKSSIYRNAPDFAVFGIGPYSFAPWKVAVAGFYAEPRFRILGPREDRPIVLGDTSYFVPFDDEADARAFGALCQSASAQATIAARMVPGKRPITKALLDTLDWRTIAADGDADSDRLRALLHER